MRVGACLILFLFGWALAGLGVWTSPARAGQLAMPSESFTARQPLQIFELELQQKTYAQAAARLDWLLRDHGHELMALPDGGLVSLHQWVMTLPADSIDPLRSAYRTEFDPLARQALIALEKRSDARPEEYDALARRYPLSNSAGLAYCAGAARALALGDPFTARTFYDLAERSGHRFEADVQKRREALNQPPSGKADAYLPFDARWHANLDSYGFPRFFPQVIQEGILIATERAIGLLQPNGAAAWSWRVPGSYSNKLDPQRPNDIGRGSLYAPAVVSSLDGAARVAVVRQLKQKSGEGCLRAFRISDGALLWSTEEREEFKYTLFVGTPASAGRYVYAIALQDPHKQASLLMLAFDVVSGELIWQSPIGPIIDAPQVRGRKQFDSRTLEEYWQQSPPAILGDSLYLAPGGGALLAMGRFDGKIRWVREYESGISLPDRDKWAEWKKDRLKNPNLKPLIDERRLTRYSSTPAIDGQVVVVAGFDSPGALGIEIQRGSILWENDRVDGTLVGCAGGVALFSGRTISGLETATGKLRWSFSPQGSSVVTGPAQLAGQIVLVPTTGGVTALNLADGKPTKLNLKLPNFRALLASEAGKKSLAELDAAGAFASPAEPAPANR